MSDHRRCQCGEPATNELAARYRHLRPDHAPEAAAEWNVLDSAGVATCGSVACEAAAMLAAVDLVITDTAVNYGRIVNPENVHVTDARRPA